jgi:hypothetical protein
MAGIDDQRRSQADFVACLLWMIRGLVRGVECVKIHKATIVSTVCKH